MERRGVQKWEKERERFEAAEKMAKAIAEKYRKRREEKWPWDTRKTPEKEIDIEGLSKRIYWQMKIAEEEFNKTSRRETGQKQSDLRRNAAKRLENFSENIGEKLRARWRKRDRLGSLPDAKQ